MPKAQKGLMMSVKKVSNYVEIIGTLWSECLELSMEAISAGSLGISAVVATKGGSIISRGRNQLFDTHESCNIVRNTSVSHAELNAIAGIPDFHRHNKELVLYTTVEPCPLCVGAIAMSKIRQVHIGSKDGWAGSMSLLDKNEYLKGKNVQISYETGIIERTFFLLHLISVWRRFSEENRQDQQFFSTIGGHCPCYLPLVSELGGNDELFSMMAEGDGAAVFAVLNGQSN